MPQRRWCALAQPQYSMKESLPDIVLLLEVDRTATASSASNESRSLQLLLVLHTLVGGAVLPFLIYFTGQDRAPPTAYLPAFRLATPPTCNHV